MPEKISQEFGHEAIEADIVRLSQEVRRLRERPETKSLGGQELLKRSLGSITGSVPASQPPSGSPLPQYAADASPEVKLEIEYLLDLAFHKGIKKAAAQAKKTNPFVFDAFHDALAGKLYPELKRRGILK